MQQGSSFSTDARALLGALLTVALILIAGYFGLTLLGPELLGLEPETQDQPTLIAYQPADESTIDESTITEAEDGISQEQLDSDSASAAEGEPNVARQTAIAQGTPVPSRSDSSEDQPSDEIPDAAVPDDEVSEREVSEGEVSEGEATSEAPSAADMLETAEAAGEPASAETEIDTADEAPETELEAGVESEAGPDPLARLTAIAQAADEVDAETPSDTPLATVPDAATPPVETPAATSAADERDVDVSLFAGANRLFGVARGAGATLYDRPEGEPVADLAAGTAVAGLARTEDVQWALIQSEDRAGWVPVDQLVMYGAENLPIFEELESVSTDLSAQPSAVEPSPTAFITPTAQPGLIETPGQPLADATPTDQPALATVASQFNRLNARTGPGTQNPVVDRLEPGSQYSAISRSADNEWIQLQLPESEEGTGWVSADFVELDQVISDLPVAGQAQAEAPQFLLPTPTPDSAVADVALPTQAPAEVVGLPSPTAVPMTPSGSAASAAPTPAASQATEDSQPAVAENGGGDGMTLYEGPGESFEVVKTFSADLDYIELERSEDGNWARIAILEPPGGVGWIELMPERSPAAEATSVEPTPAAPETPPEEEETGIQADLTPTAAADLGDVTPQVSPAAAEAATITPDLSEDIASEPASAQQTVTPSGVARPGDEVQTEPEEQAVTSVVKAIPATVVSDETLLNVRSKPNEGSEILASVEPGSVLDALAINLAGDWIQVSLPDAPGQIGWVTAEFVDLGPLADQLQVIIPSVDGQENRIDTSADSTTDGVATDTVITEPLEPPPFLPVVGEESTEGSAANAAEPGGVLVFAAINGRAIYGYSMSTGALWPITSGFDPAISPDGTTVVFARDGGDKGLYLVDIDGSNERLIYSGGQRLASPKWSPDGNWVVFSRGYDSHECYPIGANCIPVDQWGQRPVPEDTAPITSVDYYLSVIDRDGQQQHEIATLYDAQSPDWTEAGIVYQSTEGLQLTVDEPGAPSQTLTNNPLQPFVHDPDLQPNGSHIVYMGKEENHWEIFRVNSDGTGVVALTRPKTTLVDELPSSVSPAWSPDGSFIVFLSNRSESGEAGAWRLWIMDADGRNQQPLAVQMPMSYTFADEQIVSWGP